MFNHLVEPARKLQAKLKNRCAFEIDKVCAELEIDRAIAEEILFLTGVFYPAHDEVGKRLGLYLKDSSKTI